MFCEHVGERFRILREDELGVWLISYDVPAAPRFVLRSEMSSMEKIDPPEEYLHMREKNLTEGQKRRLDLISPLIINEKYIFDRENRASKVQEIAEKNKTSAKRVQRLFYRYLAGKPLVEERCVKEQEETETDRTFKWAIETHYYSAKKNSLRTSYDLMLLARYTDVNGNLCKEYPTWHQFRHYFYGNKFHKKTRSVIAREGLSNYQRNHRVLYGSAYDWKTKIGCYQIDESPADIFVVSALDRKTVIGRPSLMMAVDTATGLVAGIHVGFEKGEQAYLSCLVNAAADKTGFCKKYGIEIEKEAWPSEGLPGELITDRGREFCGARSEELIRTFGVEIQTLPPFRPDEKSLVEKTFDLLHQKYKPLLRGKGVIEEDARERWAVDYREQAVLTLEEFTKVILHCVLYLNATRLISECSERKGMTKEITPVPANLWKWYEESGKSCIKAVDTKCLYRMSLPRKKLKLTRKGLNHQGLWYVSQELKRLVEKYGTGTAVDIAYDPEDVSRIYLKDGSGYVLFELADYMKRYVGSTEEEYHAEKKQRQKTKEEWNRHETEGRIKMLRDIQQIVETAERK